MDYLGVIIFIILFTFIFYIRYINITKLNEINKECNDYDSKIVNH